MVNAVFNDKSSVLIKSKLFLLVKTQYIAQNPKTSIDFEIQFEGTSIIRETISGAFLMAQG